MALFFEPFLPLLERSRQVAGEGVRSFVPAADVVVSDEDITVMMDVPGLGPDDVAIELTDDVLTVTGERPFPYKSGDEPTWERVERGFGKFERVLRLAPGLDPDAITASVSDGVLTVRIPKPQEHKPRRIEIATGGGQRELAGSTA